MVMMTMDRFLRVNFITAKEKFCKVNMARTVIGISFVTACLKNTAWFFILGSPETFTTKYCKPGLLYIWNGGHGKDYIFTEQFVKICDFCVKFKLKPGDSPHLTDSTCLIIFIPKNSTPHPAFDRKIFSRPFSSTVAHFKRPVVFGHESPSSGSAYSTPVSSWILVFGSDSYGGGENDFGAFYCFKM